MGVFQLSEARKNLSEFVNEAYYEGKLFGISKGKKPMVAFIGIKEWHEIIHTLKKCDLGMAERFQTTLDSQKMAFESIKKHRVKQKGIVNYKALVNDGRKY